MPDVCRPIRLRTALVIPLLVLGLAGCAQSPPTSADRPVISLTSSSAATSSPTGSPSMTSSPSAPAPSSPAVPSSSAAPTKPASSAASQPDGPGGCASSALQVRALRGSGAAGHQFAFLRFTNISASSCSLTGFPGVQLQRAGAPLGLPAQRTSTPVRRVQIAPGDSVTAQLTDDSTCNAANSDAVQVIPPNRAEKFLVPLALRGCSLHIDPVISS
jgi:uncharacterized protein DUF4232